MRPVEKLVQPLGYAPPDTLTFRNSPTSQNADVMSRLLQTASPTLAQCLELWKEHVDRKMRHEQNPLNPLNPQSTPDQAEGARLVSGRIGEIYRKAGPHLLELLGSYCSYCESPLPGQLDVEHTVNKSGFPTFSCDWNNFLVACSACNGPGSKGNNPTREDIYAALRGTSPDPVFPTEAEYYAAIRTHRYVWPDLHADSHRAMALQLCADIEDGNGYRPLPEAIATNPNNRVISYNPVTHAVRADLYNEDKRVGHEVLVEVHATPTNQRAINMSLLVNLNRTNTKVTDRRVPNRTQAWFSILADIRRFLATTDRETQWEGIVENSKSRGFYSVYIRLLAGHTHNNINLAVQFALDTKTALLFPSTNLLYLP